MVLLNKIHVFLQFDYMMLFEIRHYCMTILKEHYVKMHKHIFSEITNLIEHTVHNFLSCDALSKRTIEVGVFYVYVPIWFQNDNLRTKSWIEARCGMHVYLMNI